MKKRIEDVILAYTDDSEEDIEKIKNSLESKGHKYRLLKYGINELDHFIKRVRQESTLVVFDDFRLFNSDPENLSKLKESGIAFRFYNLPAINNQNIKPVIDAIAFTKAERSRKIKEGLENRREKGGTLGNPSIGKRKGNAVRQRKLSAFKAAAGLEANKIVIEKKEIENWSYNRIADHLNQLKKTTARGAPFRAKTVQRLYNRSLELKQMFTPNLQYENLNANDEAEKGDISGLKKNAVFNKKITFTINADLESGFSVRINDNDRDDRTPVYQKMFSKDKTEVSIDLDEHFLLPGVHYISVIPEKEDSFERIVNLRIKLREDLQEAITQAASFDPQ